MAASTIVMTGASRGIGRAAAERILRECPGTHLVVAVRGPGGERVAKELRAVSGHPHVSAVSCDLASLASVRRAIGEVTARVSAGELPPLAGFVGNGGVQMTDRTHAGADGFEVTFAVNVLANHLIVRLLWAHLGAPCRIVLVGSDTHFGDLRHNLGMVPAPRWADVTELAAVRHDRRARTASEGRTAYSTSKLAVIYLVHALARRLPTGVDVYTFNPGYVPNTGLVREAGATVRLLSGTLLRGLAATPLALSVDTAGHLLARAAVGPRPGESGSYVDRRAVAPSAPHSYDQNREENLWQVMSRLCNVPVDVA